MQILNYRIEHSLSMIRRTLQLKGRAVVLNDSLAEFSYETGFPNPGITTDENNTAVSSLCLAPALL